MVKIKDKDGWSPWVSVHPEDNIPIENKHFGPMVDEVRDKLAAKKRRGKKGKKKTDPRLLVQLKVRMVSSIMMTKFGIDFPESVSAAADRLVQKRRSNNSVRSVVPAGEIDLISMVDDERNENAEEKQDVEVTDKRPKDSRSLDNVTQDNGDTSANVIPVHTGPAKTSVYLSLYAFLSYAFTSFYADDADGDARIIGVDQLQQPETPGGVSLDDAIANEEANAGDIEIDEDIDIVEHQRDNHKLHGSTGASPYTPQRSIRIAKKRQLNSTDKFIGDTHNEHTNEHTMTYSS